MEERLGYIFNELVRQEAGNEVHSFPK